MLYAAAAQRAASDEPTIVAINERAHQRQLAADLLERWTADLDAARPCVLTPSLFAQLLRAYSQSGQVHTVLLLMRQAFGCQLSPDTAAALGITSSGRGGGSGRQAAAEQAAAAADGGGAMDALDAAFEEDSSRQSAAETGSSRTQSSSSNSQSVGSSAEHGSGSGGIGGDLSSPPAAAAELHSSGSSADGITAGGWSGDAIETQLLSPLRQSTIDQAQLSPSLPIFNAAIGACTRVGHAHMRDAVALLQSMLVRGWECGALWGAWAQSCFEQCLAWKSGSRAAAEFAFGSSNLPPQCLRSCSSPLPLALAPCAASGCRPVSRCAHLHLPHCWLRLWSPGSTGPRAAAPHAAARCAALCMDAQCHAQGGQGSEGGW